METTKATKADRPRIEDVKDIQKSYEECHTVKRQKPVKVNEKEHKKLVQAKHIPTLHAMAEWSCSALPLEGEDFGQQVQTVEHELLRMTRRHKGNLIALQTAYVFSMKVTRQERRDMFQELFLSLYEHKMSDNGLAYAIAHGDWCSWWRAYKMRSHYSLDMVAVIYLWASVTSRCRYLGRSTEIGYSKHCPTISVV
jgi:hypothetical protein